MSTQENSVSAELVELVEQHLKACLPHGVPPSHSAISAVRVVSDDRKRRVVEADMIMFDGEAALLRITEHRPTFGQSMWSNRWFMDCAVFWEDGLWRRAPEGKFSCNTSPAAAA